MPSPNLIAASLARRTTDTALCVMGNSLALYNPPTRVAEEFAMIDCISGGRLIAGFPVGSPMDTCYAYGQNPSMLRERYYEAHDLVKKAWTEKETFAFSGRFNQQRYVNIWPRPIQNDRIRRSGSRAAARSRRGGGARRWTTSTAYLSYYGYKAGLRDDAGLLERDGQARQGPQSVPRRLPAVRRRRREPPAGARPLPRAGGVFLRPLPACRSALCAAAGLHDGRRRSAPASKA